MLLLAGAAYWLGAHGDDDGATVATTRGKSTCRPLADGSRLLNVHPGTLGRWIRRLDVALPPRRQCFDAVLALAAAPITVTQSIPADLA